MTTYEELWNDINFIEKRIWEQEFYLVNLQGRKDELSEERFNELDSSAMFVLNKLDARFTELLNASKINQSS